MTRVKPYHERNYTRLAVADEPQTRLRPNHTRQNASAYTAQHAARIDFILAVLRRFRRHPEHMTASDADRLFREALA